jgi:PAT family beta-lactamase induction signal transducer AmpG
MLRRLMPEPAQRLGTWGSLRAVSGSWRLLSVVLLSFASGLPLGLVWIAIPTWMARAGFDIRVIGMTTLLQAPWSFKFLWSPLMDRFPPPFLGRKRGWILIAQVALFALSVGLAGAGDRPETPWVIGAVALAIALASATQDIAIDAYAVEVLRKEEHGMAVGARVAFYRAAMLVSGGFAITLAGTDFDVPLGFATLRWEGSWPLVNALLGLCYLPMAVVAWRAPEPESLPPAPATLRDAVWGPFFGFIRQHRALEILSFVVLFKLSDNMTQGLLGPFFVQMGFDDFDVGVARVTVGNVAILLGTLLGGLLTQWRGLGPALWISGILQIFSNLGYAVVASVGPVRWVMYAAQGLEYSMSGLGNGAFGVLLLRLTQKRFSATQYALLSSLFSVPRILVGPPAALLVDAIGWRDFFIATLVTGVPGMIMLYRFVPFGVREPVFHVAAPSRGAPMPAPRVAALAGLGGLLCGAGSALALAAVAALGALRDGGGFDVAGPLAALFRPAGFGDWLTLLALGAVVIGGALATAATLVARRGLPGSGGAPEG